MCIEAMRMGSYNTVQQDLHYLYQLEVKQMEKEKCANNSYFKKKGRQRQTTGSFPPCVFLMRKAHRRGTHPRGIRAINLWKKQKMWGPPAALGRKKTNAESSDLSSTQTPVPSGRHYKCDVFRVKTPARVADLDT
jgi:hypothetical protein